MKDRNILYMTLKIIGYPFFMLIFHPKIVNQKKPETGFIVCGNHTSPLDILLLIATNRRKLHFFSKIELFSSKFKNKFFRAMGCIPVNRKEKNKDALAEGYKCLEEDKVIAIFPEGTINKTSDIIMPFKYGAVKMALETKKPILPFAIVGKYKVFGRRVKIIYGEPYNLMSDNLEKENEILMQKVIALIKGEINEKGK